MGFVATVRVCAALQSVTKKQFETGPTIAYAGN